MANTLREELLAKYNVKPETQVKTPGVAVTTATKITKQPTSLRDEILSKYSDSSLQKPKTVTVPKTPGLTTAPSVPSSSFDSTTKNIQLKPNEITFGEAVKRAPGELVNQMAKTIRASTYVAVAPLVGLAIKDAENQRPDLKGETSLAIPAMKKSLELAKEMLVNPDVKTTQAFDFVSQDYLKQRQIGKYGGKNANAADIAVLSFLGFADLFGDPATEVVGPALKGPAAIKEFMTFKKVGTVAKELPEGFKILNGVEREIVFTENLKMKIKPKQGEIVFEGYARRFPKETNVKGALGAEAASKEAQTVSDLVNSMGGGSGVEVKAVFRGDDLVLRPTIAKTGSGGTQVGNEALGASNIEKGAQNAEIEALANEPVSSALIERLKVLEPEQSAAFGRKIVDDLSEKLGFTLNNSDVKLPEDTFLKTTPSLDGRPAQINQNGQIEIFLPNLKKDIQTLASGKTILAHEGAFSTVYKMKEGESMSELATRYITDVVVHERSHLKTMTAADETARRQLQQKVYSAQASKNQNAITAAKTEFDNFMAGLEDKANAFVKSNRAELEKEVFKGKTIDTSSLTVKPASRASTKTIVNKSTGIKKEVPQVRTNEAKILKNKLRAQEDAAKIAARAGRKEGKEVGSARVEIKRTQDKVRYQETLDSIKDKNSITRSEDRSRYQKALDKIKDSNASVADKRKELIEFAELLPKSSRAKFIRAINNVKTDKQFEEIVNRIARESNLVERGNLVREITTELKGTVIKNKNKFPNVKFEYEAQKLLNRIRANINGNYSEAQIKISDLILDFQTKNPDANVTDELIREIQLLKMVGIKDMTAKELRAVLQDVKNIKESGRTAKELDRANQEAEIERIRDKIVEVITGGKPLPSDSISLNRSEGVRAKGRSGDLVEGTKNFLTTGQYGLEEVLDSLSQFDKNSKPYESFLSREVSSRVNKSFNKQNQGELAEISKINKKVKEIYSLEKNKEVLKLYEDLTKQVDLGKVMHSDGVMRNLTISRDQAIKKYMELQDPTLDDSFEEGLHWGKPVIDKMMSILTPEDIKFAEAQLEFYQEYYQGINDVFVKEFGIDLPFNENHSPIARDIDVRVPESVLLAQESAKYASAKNGSLENRKKNTIELKGAGSLETLVRHIARMEHYKAWSETMNILRKVFANRIVRQSIVDFHGKNYLQVVDNFLNDFARDGVTREKIIPMIDKLRANTTKALLGLNINVAYKQITGVLNYAIELPLDDFTKGVANFWTAPLEKSRFMYNNSAALQDRFGEGFERDIKYAIKRNVGREIANTRNFGEVMFSLIRNADKFTVFQGSWASFISKYKDITGSEFDLKNYDKQAVQQAIEYAETITARVQETSRLDTLSEVQRAGSIAKLFTMFQSQPSKYYRVMINAGRNYRAGRGSKAENVKRILMAWFVVPMIYQFVADKFQFDKKHQAKVALLGPFSYPLITGQIFQTAFGWAAGEPFKYQPSAVFAFMDDLQNGIKYMNSDDAVKAVTYVADSIGKLSGVPTGIITKPIRNALKRENESSESVTAKF